jgi:hypothetical protein
MISILIYNYLMLFLMLFRRLYKKILKRLSFIDSNIVGSFKCGVIQLEVKNITIKNSHRTLTKFMACDKVTQDTLKVELWNMQTNIQNHDLILINLAAIQKGSNATITNTDYISVQVLESNCSFTDKIITT